MIQSMKNFHVNCSKVSISIRLAHTQVGCRGGGGAVSDQLVSSPLALPWDHLAPGTCNHLPPQQKNSAPWDHPPPHSALQETGLSTLRVEASLLVTSLKSRNSQVCHPFSRNLANFQLNWKIPSVPHVSTCSLSCLFM